LEQQAVASQPSAPAAAAQAISLSIDGGHVRSVRTYQVRSFEVMLAQVSNDDGKQVVFSSMPAEADRQRDQLRGVLHRLGATPATPVTILSDGADGPRSLGEAASIGPTHHVLDWFHLAMRIQHVAQAVRSWPIAAVEDCEAGTRISETIERIRWRLWHGQVVRGLELIGETIMTLAMAKTTSPAAAAALKIARLLDELIRVRPVRYHHRLCNGQTAQGTHLDSGHGKLLKVRCAVMNGTLEHDHAVAETRACRPFRRSA
jgi:hypothetical protein